MYLSIHLLPLRDEKFWPTMLFRQRAMQDRSIRNESRYTNCGGATKAPVEKRGRAGGSISIFGPRGGPFSWGSRKAAKRDQINGRVIIARISFALKCEPRRAVSSRLPSTAEAPQRIFRPEYRRPVPPDSTPRPTTSFTSPRLATSRVVLCYFAACTLPAKGFRWSMLVNGRGASNDARADDRRWWRGW